jgi:PST family polysaccharide transporter
MPSEVGRGSDNEGHSLQRKVASGSVWNATGRLVAIGIQMLSSILLARLLTPADFGLFAMTLIFVGFAANLGNWGLANAIIQREHLTQTHLATAFWMNLAVNATITAALWIFASAIAGFFREPALTDLVRLVSLSITLQVAVVPIAILERTFRFRAIAIVESVSLALGLLAAVLAAAAGMGPMALVLQSIVLTVSWSVLSVIAARWLPLARPSRQAFRDLFSVSGWLALGNIVGYWSDNADTLALGRTAAPDQVGYYNRAYNLLLLPVRSMLGVLERVLVPAFAQMQEEDGRSRAAWLKSARMVALATYPTCVGMAAAAPAIVATLWGPQWPAVVPLLQVLALAGIASSVALACEWVILARGRGRRYFVLKCLSTLITVGAVLIGLRWGPIGVAFAMLARSCLLLPTYVVGGVREIGVSIVSVLRDLSRIFTASVLMGALVWWTGQVLPFSAPMLLATQILLGTFVYVSLLFLLDRRVLQEVRELLAMLRSQSASEPYLDAVASPTKRPTPRSDRGGGD